MTYPTLHSNNVRRLMFVGIVLMFVASCLYIFKEQSLVIDPKRPQAQMPQQEETGAMGFALSTEATDELGLLMMNLQANPNDHNSLLRIAEIFMAAEEWAKAEEFIKKAMLSAPNNTDARIFFSIARFQQNDPKGAAVALEEMLKISPDEPVAIFNLATIYKHSLGEKEKAQKLFKQLAESTTAEAELVEMSKKELEDQ